MLNKHRLAFNECIFITDTLGDILESNEIGVRTIAVDFGFHDREVLKKGNPVAIISDLSKIEETIKNIY